MLEIRSKLLWHFLSLCDNLSCSVSLNWLHAVSSSPLQEFVDTLPELFIAFRLLNCSTIKIWRLLRSKTEL